MRSARTSVRTRIRTVAVIAWMAGSASGALVLSVDAATAQSPLPSDLLPDLVQERPSDLSVTRVRGRDLLGFRSAVYNAGDGPLVIRGRRAGRGVRDMVAAQVISRTDGSRREASGAGFVRFVSSPDHSHWHFFPFERYELRREGTTAQVVRDHKSGFCLGDRYRAEPRPQGSVAAPVYQSRCGLNRTGLLTITEGISVGWGDDYAAYLDGQHLDVTGVPNGRYVLAHTVNPSGRLRERDRTNNTAVLRIALTRGPTGRIRVRVLPPG